MCITIVDHVSNGHSMSYYKVKKIGQNHFLFDFIVQNFVQFDSGNIYYAKALKQKTALLYFMKT